MATPNEPQSNQGLRRSTPQITQKPPTPNNFNLRLSGTHIALSGANKVAIVTGPCSARAGASRI
jgi:hypothetical protein